jgi:RimJ/RimL family protein N-acetyltransferase
MVTAPVELRTSRLLLRTVRRSDFDELIPLANDYDVAAMTLRLPHPYTRRDAEQFLEACCESAKCGHAVFAIEFDGKFAGCVGLHPNVDHCRAELGYWIGKPYWGKGIATEAAREVVHWGFEKQSFNRIYAGCFPENAGSMRVLEKLGFKFEGVSRENVRKWDRFVDVHVYSLLAREFGQGRH